ncbi:MAG: pyridoxamine 5-phosphate oxidase-related FMN-binding [Deltaproteobacteria bacterium]|nr:pyridoxamine 5-phosphate oxidase-related FMN-binding [Deltaproteobacteria bacterium]
MDLSEYFENSKGRGILATADKSGAGGIAVYSRPHFMEDGTLAFIMADRLSHKNLGSNPQAAYLFIEDGPRYKGKRLFLTKLREEKDSELIAKLRRRKGYTIPDEEKDKPVFLVYFKIDKVLPLIGAKE